MVRTTRKCLGEDVQLYTASSEDVWFGWGSAVWAVVILVSHVARWRTVFWAVVPPFVVYVVVRFFTAVKAESLLVVQELGVQLKTTFFNGRERYTFIDRERIQAIVLNEGFRLDAVLFYLAFVVRGSPRLILAFEVCEDSQEKRMRSFTVTDSLSTFGTSRENLSWCQGNDVS